MFILEFKGIFHSNIKIFYLQEEEVSEDLWNFHQMVNQMQEQEEEVIDEHKTLIDVGLKYCSAYLTLA